MKSQCLTTIALALAASAPLCLAATCQSNGNFQTVDATTLLGQIQGNTIPNVSIPSSIEVDATHSVKFGSDAANSGTGGPIVCINNDFLFDNTHVAISDIIAAVSETIQQCCTADTCTGGVFQVKGDTGLATDMVLQSSSQQCLNDIRGSFDESDALDAAGDIVDGIGDGIVDDKKKRGVAWRA